MKPGCCGVRGFPDEAKAMRVLGRIEGLRGADGSEGTFSAATGAYQCWRGAWHLSEPDVAPVITAPKWRADTIPPKARGLVAVRDSLDGVQLCVLCGMPGVLHCHHRRLKGIGGDLRDHANCPCNLVSLCEGCHYWAHVIGRYSAQAEGFIVPGAVLFPGEISVLVHGKDDAGGTEAWPTCSGEWSDRAPGELVAA